MASLIITILSWITLGLCTLYIMTSILFAPCELVMVGFSMDPLLITSVFPVIFSAFLYKDLAVIAIALYSLLSKFTNIHCNYDIIMVITSGIASIMTPFGFIWMFIKLRNMQALMMYQTFTDVASDPIFYDAMLAMLLFLSFDAYMIMIMMTKDENIMERTNAKYIEIVPVKKYDVEPIQRIAYNE